MLRSGYSFSFFPRSLQSVIAIRLQLKNGNGKKKKLKENFIDAQSKKIVTLHGGEMGEMDELSTTSVGKSAR